MIGSVRVLPVKKILWFAALCFAYQLAFSFLDGFEVFSTGSFLFTRVDSSYYVLKALLYVGTSTMAIIAIVCLTAHRSTGISVAAYLYVFLCLSVQLTLLSAKGQVFTVHEAFLTVGDFRFFDEAV